MLSFNLSWELGLIRSVSTGSKVWETGTDKQILSSVSRKKKKEIQSGRESTANWELWTHIINSTINDKIGRLFISEACTLVSVLAGKLGI